MIILRIAGVEIRAARLYNGSDLNLLRLTAVKGKMDDFDGDKSYPDLYGGTCRVVYAGNHAAHFS